MRGYLLPLEEEEHRITESCRLGADAALEALYKKYAPPLKVFCRKRLRDQSLAEDACHEALLRASNAIDRFRPEQRLWPWLTTIAGNVCTDMNRSERWMAEPPSEDDSVGDAEDEAFANIRSMISGVALGNLPKDYRECLYLAEFDGWSLKEIAGFFGVSVASVRGRLARGRRALKAQVKIVAKKWGQWPLPVFAPLSRLRPRRSDKEPSLFKRPLGRLRLENPANGLYGLDSLSCGQAYGLMVIVVAAGMIATGLLQPGGSDVKAEPSSASTWVAPVTPALDRASYQESSKAVQLQLSSRNMSSQAPPASTEMDIGWRRGPDQRESLNVKIRARLEGAPGWFADGDLYWFYCDSDMVNRASCNAVDTLP